MGKKSSGPINAGSYVTKGKSPEQHAAARQAAKARKQRNRKHHGATTVTTPLMVQRKLDQRDFAARAAIKALEEKLVNQPFALEVAEKVAASFVLGKTMATISREMYGLFGDKAKLGVRAFRAEVAYQMTRPQTELVYT